MGHTVSTKVAPARLPWREAWHGLRAALETTFHSYHLTPDLGNTHLWVLKALPSGLLGPYLRSLIHPEGRRAPSPHHYRALQWTQRERPRTTDLRWVPQEGPSCL